MCIIQIGYSIYRMIDPSRKVLPQVYDTINPTDNIAEVVQIDEMMAMAVLNCFLTAFHFS